jgi:hypothetical protein
MLNGISPTWLLGSWFAVVALVVAWSVSLEARFSTSALVVAVGVAPAVVMRLLRAGAPSPTVAEILHATHAKNGRS